MRVMNNLDIYILDISETFNYIKTVLNFSAHVNYFFLYYCPQNADFLVK